MKKVSFSVFSCQEFKAILLKCGKLYLSKLFQKATVVPGLGNSHSGFGLPSPKDSIPGQVDSLKLYIPTVTWVLGSVHSRIRHVLSRTRLLSLYTVQDEGDTLNPDPSIWSPRLLGLSPETARDPLWLWCVAVKGTAPQLCVPHHSPPPPPAVLVT